MSLILRSRKYLSPACDYGGVPEAAQAGRGDTPIPGFTGMMEAARRRWGFHILEIQSIAGTLNKAFVPLLPDYSRPGHEE
jgi:hypothetical protein